MTRAEKEKKEKLVPKPCVCGRTAVIVKARGGKMITCPEPMKCKANLRTRWAGHEQTAVAEWNNLVAGYRHNGGTV